MSFDRDGFERTIVSTLKMLCKNGAGYQYNLTLQGLLGITIDDDVFLIQINEQLSDADDSLESCSSKSVQPPKRPRQRPMVTPGQRRTLPRAAPMAVRRGKINSAPRVRQQLAFPGPNRLSSDTSGVFSSVGSSSPNVKVCRTPKRESVFVTEIKREDIICLESDEEVEQVKRPISIAKRVVPKMEYTQSQHNMLGLVESAINEARVIQQQSMTMNTITYNDTATYSSDVKPSLSLVQSSSSAMSMVPWTPTKPRSANENAPCMPGTPTARVKPEIPFNVTPTSKVMYSPPVAAAGRQVTPRRQLSSSPAQGRQADRSDSGSEATWTSVTQTTFVCTTGGCERRFTTKRAMVRHQKEKHNSDGGSTAMDFEDDGGGTVIDFEDDVE